MELDDKGKSTAELVKEEIKSSLFLHETLKRGMINFSALTRNLLPKIKEKNKKANFASVLIAIQRYYDEVKHETLSSQFKEILKDAELIMKTNIVDLALERTKEVMKVINEVSKTIRWDMGDIMFLIQGTGEITVIIDKKNFKKFEKIKKNIIEVKDNLAMLSLREPDEISDYSREQVGFLALLTNLLADKNINIWEAATTYKQNIFILYEKDLPKAYETLSKIIEHNKNLS